MLTNYQQRMLHYLNTTSDVENARRAFESDICHLTPKKVSHCVLMSLKNKGFIDKDYSLTNQAKNLTFIANKTNPTFDAKSTSTRAVRKLVGTPSKETVLEKTIRETHEEVERDKEKDNSAKEAREDTKKTQEHSTATHIAPNPTKGKEDTREAQGNINFEKIQKEIQKERNIALTLTFLIAMVATAVVITALWIILT